MRILHWFLFTLTATAVFAGSVRAQGQAVAAPSADAAATKPASTNSPLDVRAGEICLWGRVTFFSALSGELTLQAKGYQLPGGRQASFARPKEKRVRLQTDAILVGPAGAQLARDAIDLGHWIFVIGPDEGEGTTLKARLLRDNGATEPAISAPILPNDPPSLEPDPVEPRPTQAQPVPTQPVPVQPTPTPVKPKPLEPAPTSASLPAPPATTFMTLDDIKPWLHKVAAAFPDRVQILPLTVSAGGREVIALQIAPRSTPVRQLRRLAVICRQHGDEPETTAAGVQFTREFLTLDTPRARRLRRTVAVLIIPVANPDGASRNRRRNDSGQDLNRDWGRGRSREVSASMKLLTTWKPHLVVDIHQWVPGDRVQTPMAEASGGRLGRRTAAGMAQAARSKGYRLSYRSSGAGGTLCHRYWGGRGIPGILLETVHRPHSPNRRREAIETNVIALQRALDTLTR